MWQNMVFDFYPSNRLPVCRDGTSSNWIITRRIQNSPCLEYLLANLPEQLLSSDSFFSRYGAFLSFMLDLDILEKTGDEIATLGMECTNIWGWHHSHFGTWQGHLCTASHSKGVSWKVPRQQCVEEVGAWCNSKCWESIYDMWSSCAFIQFLL